MQPSAGSVLVFYWKCWTCPGQNVYVVVYARTLLVQIWSSTDRATFTG